MAQKIYVGRLMNKFLLIVLSPAFLFVIYDVMFYLVWIPSGNYSEFTINLMLVYFSINFILAFITIFTISAITKKQLERQVVYRKSINPFGCYMLIGIGLYSLYMHMGGSFTFDLEKKYGEVSSRGIFYIVIIQIVTYILIYDIYVGRPRPIFTFAVALFVLCSLAMGGRSGVIWLILLILFVFSLNARINLGRISLVFAFLIVAFFATSVLRGTVILSGGEARFGFLDFNQIFTLEKTISYTEENGSQLTLFFGDVADGFVPRAINPDKKTSTAFTREVFPEVSSRTSYTSGFYANLLFSFGYLGLFIAPFAQVVMTFIYLKVIKNRRKSSVNFVLIFFLVFPLLIVRGGLFEFRVVFALFLVLLAVSAHRFLRTNFVLSRQQSKQLRRKTCLEL